MDRVKFEKGKQKRFFDSVIERLRCVSLRGILQFGFDIPYSSLKNYYSERRLLPKDFFDDLCHIAKVNVNELDVEYLGENWGQIKGGKKSKRMKRKN